MTTDTPISDFDKVPFVKALIDFHTPRASVLIPLMIPYGGEILDAFGWFIFPKDSMIFFEKCCTQIIRHDFELLLTLNLYKNVQYEIILK